MPFFSGNASLSGSRLKNMVMSDSAINTSGLDMNLNHITSVKDPVRSQDAATKFYVDSQIQPVLEEMEVQWNGYMVDLKGSDFSTVVNVRPGSYLVAVIPLTDGAPSATFSVSKSSVYDHPHIVRLTSASKGPEQLDLRWPPQGTLQLRKDGPGWDGTYAVDMNMKNVSAVCREPVLPDDISTKAYVDHQIRQALDIGFGGIKVMLSGTAFSNVINQRPGSCSITVTALVDGGPTAVFAVSKATPFAEAHIVRHTSASANFTGEYLELDWPENAMIRLRKSGPGYDGEYLVDMGLRNFSAVPPPILESDVATRAFVEEKISSTWEERFGGIQVSLVDDCFTAIGLNMRPGSYIFTICPLITGGPSATFSLTKNASDRDASVVRISSMKGVDTDEDLEMTWKPLSLIKLRKTSCHHDGKYLVEVSLKNVSALPMPSIPSDAVTMEYVDTEIRKRMDAHFGGIQVFLKDDLFSPVAALRPGSYNVNVLPHQDGFPTASFILSKSSERHPGHVVRLTSDAGKDSEEQLEMDWPSRGKIRLRKTGCFHDGVYTVDVGVKNLATAPTIFPTDQATKAYVDDSIEEKMKNTFNGVSVLLCDDEWVDVVPMKHGSYTMNISPVADGGPTASFNLSKSSQKESAHIIRATHSPGTNSETFLEVSWDAFKKIRLRKSGSLFDGAYLCDFSSRNFQVTMDPPIAPTDAASKAYVIDQIKETIEAKWGGIPVTLMGKDTSDVSALRPGSYVVAVISLVLRGPTATFAVSKSAEGCEPSIVTITSSPAETGEQLILDWPANKKLRLRKTGQFCDGQYVVDCNLKNFSSTPEPSIGTDACSKEWVLDHFRELLDIRYGGVTVPLINDQFVDVVPLRAGTYTITVSPTFDNGPTASFHVSKASVSAQQASIVRVSDCPSLEGTQLELVWPAGEKLRLRKTNGFNDGPYLCDFNLKSFALVPPPCIESDVSTKDYVDRSIEKALDVKFGGYIVNLQDTTLTEVAPLRPGSYLVSVTSLVVDGPTGAFSVSKNANDRDANMVRLSGVPGAVTGCQLELLWPPNGKLCVRKTDVFYDGEYLIDASWKNLTAETQVTLPSDQVTREYVDREISSKVDNAYTGIKVSLRNDEFSPICALMAGSYVVTVSPWSLRSGPTACFTVSKSAAHNEAMILVQTQCPGDESGELLELSWKPNRKLSLRKTGMFYDGEYLVNFSAKNVAAATEVILPSDQATKDYVDMSIKERMEVNFGGIPVELHDVDFAEVAALRAGSFAVAVSSRVSGGPSATFMVSKTALDQTAHIVRVSSAPGSGLFEGECVAELELRWAANRKMELRKSRVGWDGLYVVDLSCKNLTDAPTLAPNAPSDIASRAYVDTIVADKIKENLSGMLVSLRSDAFLDVVALRIGTYFVTVSPLVDGALTAGFVISKASQDVDGCILRLTPDTEAAKLELEWPPGKKLRLRKTSLHADGEYLVDFNLRNSRVPERCAEPEKTFRKHLTVQLEGTAPASLGSLRMGAYFLSVASEEVEDAPASTFHVLMRKGKPPLITVLASDSSSNAGDNDFALSMMEDGSLALNKTTDSFDGPYSVKIY